MTRDQRHLVRHLLATIAFRVRKALEGAPESFGDFRAAPDVNTPRLLLHHMSRVLLHAHGAFGGDRKADLPELTWREEIERFFRVMRDLDDDFAEGEILPDMPLLDILVQGPVADILTHAGQLNLLRRLAGAPVQRTSFMKAEVRVGSLEPPD